MFPDVPLYTYGIIPALIFLARIGDVSIGTIRLIFTTRGYRYLAPILGFFEVVIWLLAIQQIMQNLTNPVTFFAYALGFASGTYVGILIEDRLSIGKVMLRVLTHRDASTLVAALSEAEFTVTVTDSESTDGRVRDIFSIIDRKDLQRAIALVKEHNPRAFFTVSDVRYATERARPHTAAAHVRKGK